MLRVERMASIGKLAAVVAHEINIPGGDSYTPSHSKKRLGREPNPNSENLAMLELVGKRRCGKSSRI